MNTFARKKKMGEEIYGQHETHQAGTGKQIGGREGEFSTSFISARKGFESARKGCRQPEPWVRWPAENHTMQNTTYSKQLTAIPSSRCCCTLHKLCLNKCSNKNGSASHPAHLKHTYSSLWQNIAKAMEILTAFSVDSPNSSTGELGGSRALKT